RRRWFREEKERLFAATFEAVARHGVRRDGIASRFHDHSGNRARLGKKTNWAYCRIIALGAQR
ncbi:hypothetical protein, partial [Mesorhizobium sp. M4A.F.Ca.ET.050.02.1.1]|uniref:hypothetical protein n=1 Tax=Mesorhizobium sp. M4A.F.Ca.ET.050.02.1.1 TaxID=2496754 RepID=UPI001AEC9F2A